MAYEIFSAESKCYSVLELLNQVRKLKQRKLWNGISTLVVINQVLNEKGLHQEDFIQGFSKIVDWILDSKRFGTYCTSKKYDSLQMAQQVALAGKDKIVETLEFGLEVAFGNSLATMKNETLYSKEQLYGKDKKEKDKEVKFELSKSFESSDLSIQSLISAE